MLRKVEIEEIKQIHALINLSATKGEMLPRSLGELYDNVRDYFVYTEGGRVLGSCALHVCWENLAEVRSLYVANEARGRGIGRNLVEICIDEARSLGISRIFVLTYQVEFFRKCGFVLADKKEFPHKIWTDCIKCPKFPECDETSMILRLQETENGKRSTGTDGT